MRILENTSFNFIGKRKLGFIASGIMLSVSLVSFALFGLELGVDFLGGTEFVVRLEQEVSSADVSATLGDALGDAPEVKTYGQSSDLLIRSSIGGDINELENRLVDAIDAAYPGSNTQVLSTNSVGPRIADDLKSGAILAVLFSLGIILAYIWIRFAWRFGVGAVAALAHDVTIVLGVFSLLHEFVPFELEINQVIIGALLTIVGYSLNDTVVVFDRIREYSSVYKTVDYEGMVNRAINSTLSRTIVTSGTTFIVVLVLFLFGGEVLSGFAFALILGILIGTYSSIFVASPIVVELHNRTTKKVVA